MRDSTLKPRTRTTFVWIGDSSQEIGCGLTSRALETEIDKVLTSLVGRSEVDGTTLVKKNGLVKEIVNVFRLREKCVWGEEQ